MANPKTNAELIQLFQEASHRRSSREVLPSAAQEIRALRAQVTSLEEELRVVQSHWREHLQDDRTLVSAQNSAREKHATRQAEQMNSDLKQTLQQQQIKFATLQTAILHAPLNSRGKEMFEALHFDTHLGTEPVGRERVLLQHNERSTTTLPFIVDKFAKITMEKYMANQDEEEKISSMLPLSQVDVTGCEDHTLVSSVFVSEIPCTSLERVYDAVLAYFDAIPNSMKLHFGVNTTRTRLNSPQSPVLYRRSSFVGPGLPSTVNNILCSELTASHGVVHLDAVMNDPLHPESSPKYSICGLTITPQEEPATGKMLSITLRWLVVYCYNLLPYHPAIKTDLEIIWPILNGDLITASVCSHIQNMEQQNRRA